MSLFGSVPIDCSVLARRIVESVRARNLPENGKGSDTAWTLAVKAILREIGHEPEFEVFPGLSQGKQHCEFLLDLIWYSEGGGIELAAEIQWNQPLADDLKDFKKLVYVKSPIKTMIYWTQSHAIGEKIRGEICRYMEKYNRHAVGEEYLLVEFDQRRDDRCYWYVVPQDGTNTPILLIPIQLSQTVAAVPI